MMRHLEGCSALIGAPQICTCGEVSKVAARLACTAPQAAANAQLDQRGFWEPRSFKTNYPWRVSRPVGADAEPVLPDEFRIARDVPAA